MLFFNNIFIIILKIYYYNKCAIIREGKLIYYEI